MAGSCGEESGFQVHFTTKQKILSVEAGPFAFDHVFGGDSTQEQMYDKVRDSINDVLNGFNTTIFAYGQTGNDVVVVVAVGATATTATFGGACATCCIMFVVDDLIHKQNKRFRKNAHDVWCATRSQPLRRRSTRVRT